MNPATFAGFNIQRTFPETRQRAPLAKRLERFRADKARGHALTGHYYGNPPDAGQDARGFYLASDFAPGLRWRWCDDVVSSIRHHGWYTNDYGDGDTIRGIVMTLPHGRGFLAGWSMGRGMASMVETYIYDNQRDAAHAADQCAEQAADRQRDYEREDCDYDD